MSTLLDMLETGEFGTEALNPPVCAALLEIPEIRQRVFRMSVDAYVSTMEGRPTELLRGIIIQKVSKSPIHDYIIQEIREILARQVSSDFIVVQERALKFADSVPEPDVAVLRGRKADYRTTYPATAALAVEVAVTSRSIDRAKALIYAEAKVAEYWIVVPEKDQVEIYRSPSPAGYAEALTLTAPAVLHSSALPGVSVDLAALFGDV